MTKIRYLIFETNPLLYKIFIQNFFILAQFELAYLQTWKCKNALFLENFQILMLDALSYTFSPVGNLDYGSWGHSKNILATVSALLSA